MVARRIEDPKDWVQLPDFPYLPFIGLRKRGKSVKRLGESGSLSNFKLKVFS